MDFNDNGVTVTVTRSAGADDTVVVFIDTPYWEPDGSDGGPGLRVRINDESVYEGRPHLDTSEDRPAPTRTMYVGLAELYPEGE